MTPAQKQSLADLVGRIIDQHRAKPRISPSSIATEAAEELDPTGMVRRGATLLWLACHLYLRQVARQLLAHRFMPKDENEGEQSDLFPGLQWRYPMARTERTDDPIYVLLELAADNDLVYNAERLRREANAKLKHADALDAYRLNRTRTQSA